MAIYPAKNMRIKNKAFIFSLAIIPDGDKVVKSKNACVIIKRKDKIKTEKLTIPTCLAQNQRDITDSLVALVKYAKNNGVLKKRLEKKIKKEIVIFNNRLKNIIED